MSDWLSDLNDEEGRRRAEVEKQREKQRHSLPDPKLIAWRSAVDGYEATWKNLTKQIKDYGSGLNKHFPYCRITVTEPKVEYAYKEHCVIYAYHHSSAYDPMNKRSILLHKSGNTDKYEFDGNVKVKWFFGPSPNGTIVEKHQAFSDKSKSLLSLEMIPIESINQEMIGNWMKWLVKGENPPPSGFLNKLVKIFKG
jgi:hypothetical protein